MESAIYRVLTTDNRSVDLDIRQEKRRVVGIIINRFGEEQPQADSRHDRHTGLGSFISKERRIYTLKRAINYTRELTNHPKQIPRST